MFYDTPDGGVAGSILTPLQDSPQGPLDIAWAHPLAEGLIFLSVPGNRYHLEMRIPDLVTAWTDPAALRIAGSSMSGNYGGANPVDGVEQHWGAASIDVFLTPYLNFSGTQNFTIGGIVNFRSTLAGGQYPLIWSNFPYPATMGNRLWWNGDLGTCYFSGGTLGGDFAGFSDTAAGERHVVATYDGTNLRTYKDGTFMNSSGSYANSPLTDSRQLLSWTNGTSGTNLFNVKLVYAYRRALSATEITDFYSNWRDLIHPISRPKAWYVPTAAPTFKAAWANQRSRAVGVGMGF